MLIKARFEEAKLRDLADTGGNLTQEETQAGSLLMARGLSWHATTRERSSIPAIKINLPMGNQLGRHATTADPVVTTFGAVVTEEEEHL